MKKRRRINMVNLVYGALLLHSAGKELNEANIQKVADATGETVDGAQVKALVAALDGVNIAEAVKKAAAPVAVAAAPAASGEAKKEEVEEDNTEEKSENAAAGLSSLFG
jgi:large subunit ribosomal protein L12